MASVRRIKWHPPPPPRILHFPRRTHRRKPTNKKPRPGSDPFCTRSGPKWHNLETHFKEEKVVVLLNSASERKRPVECGGDDVEERESEGEIKWRFQAEMLRAECSFLRKEREIAVKKLKKERCLVENSFQSALRTLRSGKMNMKEGKNANLVIEEEIEELAKKLVEFRRCSRMKDTFKVKKCSNLDQQASLLKKHLGKLREMGEEVGIKDITKISGASSSTSDRTSDGRIRSDRRSSIVDVETLRRKMEGLSKGKLLKRMEEEYGSMLSVTTNCSAPSSASTSRNFDLPEFSSFSFRQSSQEAKLGESCSGNCKAIARRIMEQVRAETEQWSQMQEMLGQVKAEMEELQASRDFWEERALQSDYQLHALQSEVEEWKGKVQSSERKENKLQKQLKDLQQELKRLTVDKNCGSEVKPRKDSASTSLGAQLEREKRLLSCRLKGRRVAMEKRDQDIINCSDGDKVLISSNRIPFKDIGNVSTLKRQNGRRYVYPLYR